MNEMAILDRVISRNGITMRIEKVSFNPIQINAEAGEGIEHYRCRLSKPGRQTDVYLSIHTADGLLTASDVLFMLVMDAFGCRMMEGYEQYKDEITSVLAGSDGNSEEIENFWEEYGHRCKQTEKLKSFLGESLYNEMLHQMECSGGVAGMF